MSKNRSYEDAVSEGKILCKAEMLALMNRRDSEILRALSRYKGGISDFLYGMSYSVNDAEAAIELIARACNCLNIVRVRRLLKIVELHKSTFIHRAIPNIIHKAVTGKVEIDLPKLILNYLHVLMCMLKIIEAYGTVVEVFPEMQNYINRMKTLKYEHVTDITIEYHCLEEELEKYEQNLARKQAEEQNPPEDFRTLSIVPRKSDVLNCKIPFLRANIIDRFYDDVEHYLDIHFRLMREDMLRTFRKSISEYKYKVSNEFDNARVYKGVNVHVPPEYTCNGILYEVYVKTQNDTYWASKKILLPGTLVCLTYDDFQTVTFVTVKSIETKSDPSKECVLKVGLEHPKDELYADKVYTMFETDAYFEPYRHVLSAMKEHSEVSFPLSDCIVYLDNEDADAEHFDSIQFCLHESCNATELTNVSADSDHPCKVFNVLNSEEWPTAEELKLDEYQHKAFQTALTKKLALIQGPPGTGKTFLGIKIVKALLDNAIKKPIIISCYTNHALDQFLEHTLLYTKKVVRLGLQSRSEMLQPHIMSNILQVTREYNYQHDDDFKFNDPMQVEIMKVIKLLVKEVPQLKKADEDEALRELREICIEINRNYSLLERIKSGYFDDGILNIMIPLDIKEMLLKGAGSSAAVLSRNLREWLCFSKSGDIYQRCEDHWNKSNKQYDFDSFVGNESLDDVDDEGEERINVWKIPLKERFDILFHWRKNFAVKVSRDIQEGKDKFEKTINKIAMPPNSIMCDYLRNADIIGVTTSGGAKFREYIRIVRPTIMVIEEAAEILEAHIIASLVPSLQHLILIGDHEQLRPLPADHDLATDYNLNISLFERLFKNNAPSATLCSQHRMRPCIADLLVPDIYQALLSDKSVYKYEEIIGTKNSMFFLQHDIVEDSRVGGKSFSNKYEAQFIAKLYHYFILQGYEHSQITVLSAYAQQIVLLNEFLDNKDKNIKVTTVDNYQGEENDIIIISFVRNSHFDSIGFLKESNRVCVALSRARKGLFCFGNFEFYARKSKLWTSIVDKLKKDNVIGKALPLKCKNHPEEIMLVEEPKDFDDYTLGGCHRECGYILPCEHVCQQKCHFDDPLHQKFKCLEPCERMISSSSGLKLCKKRCWQPCESKKKTSVTLKCGHKVVIYSSALDIFLGAPKCNVEVSKRLPCGHCDTLPCYVSVDTYQCKASTSVVLPCGHPSSVPCHNKLNLGDVFCQVMKEEKAKCGHRVEVPCHIYPDESVLLSYCNKSCDAELNCVGKHPCTGPCSWCFRTKIHSMCRNPCNKRLPCGHKCPGFCGAPCSPCGKKCMMSCSHSHCINGCSKPCVKCQEPCSWQCEHSKCDKECYKDCDEKPCNEPCQEVLSCGHPCIGFCGEPCPVLCRVCNIDELESDKPESDRFVMLEDCDHVIEVQKLTLHINEMVESFQWPVCPKCSKSITKSIRYIKVLKRAKCYALQSVDCSDKIQELFFHLHTMFGESSVVTKLFQDVFRKMKRILEHEKPNISVLTVLEDCILALKELVNINEMLRKVDEYGDIDTLEEELYDLLDWICNHLQCASYHQLYELDNSVKNLKKKVTFLIR